MPVLRSILSDMLSFGLGREDCLVAVGGGVVVTNVNWSEVFCNDLETGKMLKEAGADILVAGNTVFRSENPIQTIHDLKNL